MYITLRPDGTYTRKSEVDLHSERIEDGTFMVHGQLITWMPNGEVSYANMVAADQAGALVLDGKIPIRCI